MIQRLLPVILLLVSFQTSAQSASSDKAVSNIRTAVEFLASDKLEGRRTGTAGEKAAYEFIISSFKKTGLSAFPENSNYLQAFEVKDGRKVEEASLVANGVKLQTPEDYFPLSFSGDAQQLQLDESKSSVTYYYSLQKQLNANSNNPHFDLRSHIREKAIEAQKQGLRAMWVLAADSSANQLAFDKNDKQERLPIPVILIKQTAFEKIMAQQVDATRYAVNFRITENTRTGHNVLAYLNNNAAYNVVIGAHYDHLGYGEDHNSLYTGSQPQVHNGADDNASGTAALLEMARQLKKEGPKQFNYIFLAFSGEELGLYGSKYFTEHSPVPLSSINYMINMDMVGRLNDSSLAITIGGYGTSPEWGKIIRSNEKALRIKTDSAGSGPSDHTSFYRKDIPVLFFFTRTHSDYHKPSDDANKINYAGTWQVVQYILQVINETSQLGKLSFSKTRETSNNAKSSFKVTMGIMPDYTFSGPGVMVDGVSDGRPASKAGIKAGDVVLQLGEHAVADVQQYMQALNKFNKGDKTTVKIKRAAETLVLELTF
jgi:hypothetical protein